MNTNTATNTKETNMSKQSRTINVTIAIIETMPEHLRASHRAAGNWGSYPHNGAERSVVPADEVEFYDDGEYDHVVCEYSATLDEDGISVHDSENHLLGRGTWNGSIVDCAADLGDDVYEALDAALIAAGAPASKPWDCEGYWELCSVEEDAPTKDDVSASDWETVASYVATYPSDDGEGACDVQVQIGEAGGRWFVRTTDDGGGSDECDATAYETRDAAEEAATDYAWDNDAAKPGEDAEKYLTRQLEETAGEPTADGEWCVYWETAGDDAGPRERYGSQDAAMAAAELENAALHAAHPGGNLLCGFSIRELVDGEWVASDDE